MLYLLGFRVLCMKLDLYLLGTSFRVLFCVLKTYILCISYLKYAESLNFYIFSLFLCAHLST